MVTAGARDEAPFIIRALQGILMGRDRYTFADLNLPYFMTMTVVEWLPLFCRPNCASILLESLRFQCSERGLRINAYVLMEDHLHLIGCSRELDLIVARFKSFTARQIIAELTASGARDVLFRLAQSKAAHKVDRTYQVWQEGSHPKAITSVSMMRQKIRYIHDNPVRRGYVDDPTHWRYSSARDYAGVPGLVPVDTEW